MIANAVATQGPQTPTWLADSDCGRCARRYSIAPVPKMNSKTLKMPAFTADTYAVIAIYLAIDFHQCRLSSFRKEYII